MISHSGKPFSTEGNDFPRWKTIFHRGKPFPTVGNHFATVGFLACLVSRHPSVGEAASVENGCPPWEVISHHFHRFPPSIWSYTSDSISRRWGRSNRYNLGLGSHRIQDSENEGMFGELWFVVGGLASGTYCLIEIPIVEYAPCLISTLPAPR